MTELGAYILGAAALVILAWAGAAAGNSTVLLCAVIASGAAYVSQFGAAHAVVHTRPWSYALGFGGLVVALGAWGFGVSWLLF
jgi:hypothetical protein